AELRRLLFNYTSDPRLQNPKIEKAEILDLAVEYLKKWTDRINLHDGWSIDLNILSAGFQQCVAQLTGHMHRISPAQRASLIERLRHHTESCWHPKADFSQAAGKTPDAAPAQAICTSDSKEECPGLLFPSQCPFQPHSCSTPCHEYLSPPPSPWYSPPFPMCASSSPFPSFACSLSSAPSSSPPSSNTSFFSFSPSLPHSSGLQVPPLTVERASANPAHEEALASNASSAMWRPWFK
uniref:BHLH domain-containing protein n=1 Tax=Salarias fasciatus TaxID=181472 RepID=A0A672HPC3_SALFA